MSNYSYIKGKMLLFAVLIESGLKGYFRTVNYIEQQILKLILHRSHGSRVSTRY